MASRFFSSGATVYGVNVGAASTFSAVTFVIFSLPHERPPSTPSPVKSASRVSKPFADGGGMSGGITVGAASTWKPFGTSTTCGGGALSGGGGGGGGSGALSSWILMRLTSSATFSTAFLPSVADAHAAAENTRMWKTSDAPVAPAIVLTFRSCGLLAIRLNVTTVLGAAGAFELMASPAGDGRLHGRSCAPV